ncbi:MAG: ribosome maturation factor RimP [Pseudomonadota bacterium]
MAVEDDVSRLLRPTIESMNFEFIGLEYLPNPKNRLLRVYIDRAPGGVTVDDCAELSREISALLDVEDPIRGEYSLEVSSPGAERPLFEAAHYRQFAGHEAVLQLYSPHQGRRKLSGTLIGASEHDEAQIEVDGELFTVPLSLIRRANLKPDFDALLAGHATRGSN